MADHPLTPEDLAADDAERAATARATAPRPECDLTAPLSACSGCAHDLSVGHDDRVDAIKTSLGHAPEKSKWEFDATVAACFDDMLARSIPDYEEMRRLVTALASRYAISAHDAKVVDLGASRGEALAPLIGNRFLKWATFYAVETAPAMLAELRARWPRHAYEQPTVIVDDRDLRKSFAHAFLGSSVFLSVLTLQFVPIEHRLRIVRDVWKSLRPGGVFILVEKVLGATADLDDAFVAEYYAKKRANGYTQEEIDRKRLSLEGVLVPVTARWNEDLLRGAGFQEVDCFWRNLNFAGWIATKT